MTLFISEFAGLAYVRSVSGQPSIPASPGPAVTQVSSGGSTASITTVALSSATRLVQLIASGSPAFFNIGGSSTAAAPTSTQVEFVPVGVPILRGVNPRASLFAFSS